MSNKYLVEILTFRVVDNLFFTISFTLITFFCNSDPIQAQIIVLFLLSLTIVGAAFLLSLFADYSFFNSLYKINKKTILQITTSSQTGVFKIADIIAKVNFELYLIVAISLLVFSGALITNCYFTICLFYISSWAILNEIGIFRVFRAGNKLSTKIIKK